mgnify:CR=1 FL=1
MQSLSDTQNTDYEIIDNHELSSEANSIIKKYTLLTSGACLIPSNIIDVLSTTTAQAMMVRELCDLYEIDIEGKMGKIALWSGLGSLFTKAITEVVSVMITKSHNGLKYNLTGAAVAGIYTASVGEFHHLHFQNGGDLDNIEVKNFTDHFINEIKKGDISLATFTNPTALLNHLSN